MIGLGVVNCHILGIQVYVHPKQSETKIWVQEIHVGGNPSQSMRVGRRETGKEGKPIECY